MHTLRECPVTFVSQFSKDVIQLHLWSQAYNNALPESGGINDQIAVVMEALSIVRDEQVKVDRWREHEMRKKADKEQNQQQFAKRLAGRQGRS